MIKLVVRSPIDKSWNSIGTYEQKILSQDSSIISIEMIAKSARTSIDRNLTLDPRTFRCSANLHWKTEGLRSHHRLQSITPTNLEL